MPVFLSEPRSGMAFLVRRARIGTIIEQHVRGFELSHLSSRHQRGLANQTVFSIHIGSLRDKEADHFFVPSNRGT